jgi:hypothetical protein
MQRQVELPQIVGALDAARSFARVFNDRQH